MNRNEAEKIFNAVGGKRKLIAWAKLNNANYAQLLSLIGRDALGDVDVQHVSPVDDAAIRDTIGAAILGIVNSRAQFGDRPPAVVTMISDDGSRVASAANPGGNIDTPQHVANRPGITSKEVAAPQALPTPESKPTPDVPSRSSNAKPAQRSEPTILGINITALEGGSSGQQSATELYLQSVGTARPSWSPPRSWSGSGS
jgi:hypothetical protein